MKICFTLVLFLSFFLSSYCQIDLSISIDGAVQVSNGPSVDIVEGSDLEFNCTTSVPSAVVTLTTNPNLVRTSVNDDGNPNAAEEFTLSDVRRNISDTTFICRDEINPNVQFTINVQYRPAISDITNSTALVGEPVNITFTVDANPNVTSDSYITVTNTPDNIIIDGSQVTLEYTELQQSDTGIHTVTVENSVGPTKAIFELNVYFSPIFASTNDTNIEVTVGQTLITINCTVSQSNPPVTSIQLTGSGLNTPVDITDTQFYNTNFVNGSIYTCEASNGETDNTSITFIVTVMSGSTSVTTSTLASTSTSSTSSTSSTPGVIPSRNPQSNAALSDGEIAGIVIGIIVGVALIIIGVLIIIFVIVYLSKRSAKA